MGHAGRRVPKVTALKTGTTRAVAQQHRASPRPHQDVGRSFERVAGPARVAVRIRNPTPPLFRHAHGPRSSAFRGCLIRPNLPQRNRTTPPVLMRMRCLNVVYRFSHVQLDAAFRSRAVAGGERAADATAGTLQEAATENGLQSFQSGHLADAPCVRDGRPDRERAQLRWCGCEARAVRSRRPVQCATGT